MSQQTTKPQLSKTPQSREFGTSETQSALILRNRLNHEPTDATHSTDDTIVIEAPGLEPCEIRVMLIAGRLSIRGEKLDLKGKGKENEGFSQRPSKIGNHLEVDIELPIGIQAKDIEAILCAGRLIIQLPSPSLPCARIAVVEIDADEGDMHEE